MSEDREISVGDTRVTTPDGLVSFNFNDDGVTIVLACDKAFVPWPAWEQITRAYGRKGS